MEFDFNIEETIGNVTQDGIVYLSGQKQNYNSKDFKNICTLLNTIGEFSAKVILKIYKKFLTTYIQAQSLPVPITSASKFFGTDHHIFLMCNKNKFIGFIKVGYKHLFIYDESGTPNEINPLCVLDFYTFEKCQRQGNGIKIYNEMIQRENVEPRKLGYDRPSIKFLNFLNKYFGLNDYIPQNNNYVVFKDYFIDEPPKRDRYDIYTKRNYNENKIKKVEINRSNNINYRDRCTKTQRLYNKRENIYDDKKEDVKKNNGSMIENKKDYGNNYGFEYENNYSKDYKNPYNDNKLLKELNTGNSVYDQKNNLVPNDKNFSRFHKKDNYSYQYQYRPSSSDYGAFFHK